MVINYDEKKENSKLFSVALGNGCVDFDEFLTMMKRRRSTCDSDTELHQVFQVDPCHCLAKVSYRCV